jgi:hypothetical protein
MKLTKGKISKLHHKKRQSVRKYKKRGKTHHKTKTLRRKHRPVNLVRTTLKNYNVWFGGQDKDEDENEDEDEKAIDYGSAGVLGATEKFAAIQN